MNTFKTESGKLYVTDPCYMGFDPKYQALVHVRPGIYTARVKPEGGCIAQFMITLEDRSISFEDQNWEEIHGDIAVDSGQCGFFDFNGEEPIGGDYGTDDFYGRACEATIETGELCIKEGAVSRSGYGEGGYPLFVLRDENEHIVALKLVFIRDEEDEDEDPEDEDEFDNDFYNEEYGDGMEVAL